MADCKTCFYEPRSPQSMICRTCGIAMKNYAPKTPEYDPDEFFNRKKPSNADRIRAMSDEELAAWLYNVCCIEEPFECPALNQPTKNIDCRTVWLDWLRQEADT